MVDFLLFVGLDAVVDPIQSDDDDDDGADFPFLDERIRSFIGCRNEHFVVFFYLALVANVIIAGSAQSTAYCTCSNRMEDEPDNTGGIQRTR